MSKSQPVRILIVVMSLVLGLGALALAVPKMGSSALASASSGWVARPAHTIRITSTQTDRYGADVIGLKVLKTGRGSVWRKISPAGEIGSVFVATGAVSGRRNGQRATLVVRELVSGKAVQTRRATGRIHSGRTLHLSVAITRTRTGSRFALGLKVPKVYRGQRLLVSDAALRTSHGKPPKPSPTSSPTSSPTASPTSSPTASPTTSAPTTSPTTSPTSSPTSSPTTGAQLSNGCSYSARGLPSCGTYLGAAHGSNTDPADLEAVSGGRLGIRRTYWTASQVGSAVSVAKSDLAHGRLPWISFKFPYTWAEMASGKGDAWARDIATRLSALPGPVWIAFHHEPEGDGDITTWRTIQERLAPLVRSTASNVGYTVIVTGWNEFYGDAQYHLDNLWPRNVKIDVAGFDIYNQYGVVKNGVMNTKGTDLKTAYFDKIAPWAAAHNVAWGLGETGYTDPASEVDPDWIKRTYGQMNALGGIAFAYFDTTLNSVANWALSTDIKKQAYARARSGAPVLPPLS